MKKLLIFLSSILILAAAIPWALYELGMTNMSMRPAPPENPIHGRADEHLVWTARKEVLPPVLRPVTPWHFYHLLWCSKDDRELEDFLTCGNEYPGLRAAAYAAKYHLKYHIERNGIIWRYLSRTALAIHISRYWSKEQLISYLIKIHRSGYIGN